jgi:hypothetical protein
VKIDRAETILYLPPAMRSVVILLVFCSLAVAAAGCGGSGNGVSKAEYRSELAKISKQAGAAHQAVELGAPQAATVAQVEALLRQFAAAEDRIGDEVSKLRVPQDARAANAELARAQHDDAAEIRAMLPKLARFKSVHQAFGFLQSLGHTKGGQEGADALRQLQQLGYTSSG